MTEQSDGQAAEGPGQARPDRGRRAARAALRVLGAVLNVAFGVATLAMLVAGMLWLRLAEGPIRLPLAADAVARAFNAGSDRLRAEAGDVILSLGEAGTPAGVRFVDVRISYATGEPIFVVPRLAARFDLSDLVQGRLRPIRITVIRPEARVVRTADGRFRFGLGAEAEPPGAAPGGDALPTGMLQAAAIGRILDGLAGDAEPIPELSRLEEIVIRDANLVFENEEIGRRWHTRHADLRVTRTADGLRARMEVGLADAEIEGAGAVITAERRRGTGGATRFEARFERLRPEHLAEQIDQMAWLRLFDAPLDGRLALTIFPDGRVEGLSGRISAGAGRILALGDEGQPLESATLAFAYEFGRERMRIEEFTLRAPAAEARVSGFADIRRDAAGEIAGLDGQFEVARLRAELPQVFAGPLAFDAGQIVARLDLAPLRIRVADSHLRAGNMVLEVAGESRAGEAGWETALRAAGRNLTIAQLVQFWPHVAAGPARAWVEENIPRGSIDSFVAQLHLGPEDRRLNLDFAYSGIEAKYLGDMTPIVEADGRGSLTLDGFDMVIESGEVRPVEGTPVRLDGSTLRIPSLSLKPVRAEITLRGTGETAHVLALIDEAPLLLSSKLGLDPADVGGLAEVTARLSVPLIDGLRLGDVGVVAEATLRDLALPFELPGGHVADIRADEVALRADPQAMRVSGPVTVDGTPLNLEWNEYYGRGSDHRDVAVSGPVTPEFLARLDLDSPYFADGRAPIRLQLVQSGSPGLDFDLDADLGPARLSVPEFDWEKAPGAEGHLRAEGTFGEGIRARRFRLETEALKANGAITFGADGGMQSADVERLRFRGLADVSLRAARGSGGEDLLVLDIGGRRLDLALFESDGNGDGSEGAPGRPISATFDLGALVVRPGIEAEAARGTYRRDAAGAATATLTGRLDGRVPFTADYERPRGEPASVVVRSEDAGGLLSAAGLFWGAEGGRIRLEARLAPEEGVEIAGKARIRDVRLRSGETFGSILEEGGVDEAADAAKKGGLAFDRVDAPFEYSGDRLELGETIAKGNMLAVKVEGTVDRTSDEVDLVGVISPAYGLTGVLDSIPLLGTILSGGKGEGILAMTFRVTGPLENPDFSVNPLSLLTPGILRSIFSGRTSEPDPRFLERLRRETD